MPCLFHLKYVRRLKGEYYIRQQYTWRNVYLDNVLPKHILLPKLFGASMPKVHKMGHGMKLFGNVTKNIFYCDRLFIKVFM